jgi:4-hydroxy-3-methylbut-2-en-1-yl diphosphate synthase IspG/GcpE
MTSTEIIDLIKSTQTPEQIRTANKVASEFLRVATTTLSDAEAVRSAKSEALNTMLDTHEGEQQEVLRYPSC